MERNGMEWRVIGWRDIEWRVIEWSAKHQSRLAVEWVTLCDASESACQVVP